MSRVVDWVFGKSPRVPTSWPYGTIRLVNGKPTLTNVKHDAPHRIGPPDGVTSLDLIRSGFTRQYPGAPGFGLAPGFRQTAHQRGREPAWQSTTESQPRR